MLEGLPPPTEVLETVGDGQERRQEAAVSAGGEDNEEVDTDFPALTIEIENIDPKTLDDSEADAIRSAVIDAVAGRLQYPITDVRVQR